MSVTAPISRFVINLGHAVRIPIGEGRVFQVGKTSIAVFRTRGGGIFATQGACPHKGGPLADSIVGSNKVICPLHGYGFDLQTGTAQGHNCGPLKTYPVSVNHRGEIVVTLDSIATS